MTCPLTPGAPDPTEARQTGIAETVREAFTSQGLTPPDDALFFPWTSHDVMIKLIINVLRRVRELTVMEAPEASKWTIPSPARALEMLPLPSDAEALSPMELQDEPRCSSISIRAPNCLMVWNPSLQEIREVAHPSLLGFHIGRLAAFGVTRPMFPHPPMSPSLLASYRAGLAHKGSSRAVATAMAIRASMMSSSSAQKVLSYLVNNLTGYSTIEWAALPTPGAHLTAPLIYTCSMDPMGPERLGALATLAEDYPSDDESEGLPELLEAEDSGNESAAPSYAAPDQDEAHLASPDPDETGAATAAHNEAIQWMIDEGIITPVTPPPPGDEDWHPIPRWGEGWSQRICPNGSPFPTVPTSPQDPPRIRVSTPTPEQVEALRAAGHSSSSGFMLPGFQESFGQPVTPADNILITQDLEEEPALRPAALPSNLLLQAEDPTSDQDSPDNNEIDIPDIEGSPPPQDYSSGPDPGQPGWVDNPHFPDSPPFFDSPPVKKSKAVVNMDLNYYVDDNGYEGPRTLGRDKNGLSIEGPTLPWVLPWNHEELSVPSPNPDDPSTSNHSYDYDSNEDYDNEEDNADSEDSDSNQTPVTVTVPTSFEHLSPNMRAQMEDYDLSYRQLPEVSPSAAPDSPSAVPLPVDDPFDDDSILDLGADDSCYDDTPPPTRCGVSAHLLQGRASWLVYSHGVIGADLPLDTEVAL